MHRWLSILLVSVGVVSVAGASMSACSGSGTGDPFGNGGAGGNPPLLCEDVDPPPPTCGDVCNSDADCGTGTYCDGTCTFQCTSEVPCPAANFDCNVRGRCIQTPGGTGGTGNVGGGCQNVEVTPTRSIPNVMFLVDQSGSMTSGFSQGQDRWQAAHSAINDIVGDLESVVRFGLTSYTSDDGNDPCPRLPVAGDPDAASPRVDFGLNNASAIGDNAVYPSNYPSDAGDETPTGDSIDLLVSIIQSDPPPAEGPTIIVLATDGEPDTCEQPNPQNGQGEAVTAATAAHAAGIDVFILSVGDQVGAAHLQDMANVGIGLAEDGSEGNAPFWVGNNPEELETAFNEIIGASISCDIEIDKPFADVDAACNAGDVRLNGQPLDCPTDWRVKPGVNNVIELVGTACDTFKTTASTFTAEFPCGAIVVE